MEYKVKNKTYQPLPLIIEGRTVILPKRKSIMLSKISSQMAALKSKGMLQIIKK